MSERPETINVSAQFSKKPDNKMASLRQRWFTLESDTVKCDVSVDFTGWLWVEIEAKERGNRVSYTYYYMNVRELAEKVIDATESLEAVDEKGAGE